MAKVQDALALQGGGALGAYELGAIRRLWEEENFRPTVATGVSIGAVNAAVLLGAKGNPLDALEAVWERFSVEAPWPLPEAMGPFLTLFGNPGMFRPRLDLFAWHQWTGLYDTAPLRAVLEEYIDFDALNRSAVKLAVTVANVQSGMMEVFDNHSPEYELGPDHIIASCSLPPGFPMTQVGKAFYWDGGLFDNTPLLPAIERLDPDPEVRKRLFVIKLFPNEGDGPQNLLEVSDRIVEMVFSGKMMHDIKTANRINEYISLVQHIDALLESAPDRQLVEFIRKHPAYQRLQQYMALEEIVCIENTHPEIVTGPFDFSRQRVRERIEAGYQDADKALSSMRM